MDPSWEILTQMFQVSNPANELRMQHVSLSYLSFCIGFSHVKGTVGFLNDQRRVCGYTGYIHKCSPMYNIVSFITRCYFEYV